MATPVSWGVPGGRAVKSQRAMALAGGILTKAVIIPNRRRPRRTRFFMTTK
jgi:hypothetical protein